MATLPSRSAKPGVPVELVVTVREATRPTVLLPSELSGLNFRVLSKPRFLSVGDDKVWLFRYRIIPKAIGDYEIPPLRVLEGTTSVETKPLFLHVSKTGVCPPLSAKELATGVDIPDSLSEEVLKAAPQPTPRPTPSPTPRDTRNFGERAGSSLLKGLNAIWNYPGK